MGGTFKEQLNADIKAALKSGDKETTGALRLILAAMKQFEVDHRVDLDVASKIEVLSRMAKQRRESITQFEAAGREDLAARERRELELIMGYLPQPLTEAEIDERIAAAIAASGASTLRDMGKVMGMLSGEIKGRADMAVVSAKVKSRLAG